MVRIRLDKFLPIFHRAFLVILPMQHCDTEIEQRLCILGIRLQRLLDKPIISPDLDASIGPNIQGPSLIRVPDWVPGKLGKYYLYFADHKGAYIRLAYA